MAKLFNSNRFSFYLPLILGAGVSALFGIVFKKSVCIPNIEFLLNAVINCTATFSGFVLTAISILIGLRVTPIMKEIESKENVSELLLSGAESLVLGLVLIIYCVVVGGNYDAAKGKVCVLSSVESVLGSGVITAYFFSLLFICYFVFNIIILSTKPERKNSGDPSSPDGEYRI